jgi:GntR family transcriptional regulator, transcriptional repressor for pyruvate dehydrogenase complex
VRSLPIEALVRSVGFLVRSQRLRLKSVFHAREAVEPACARLAALNRTEESILQLHRATQQMEDAGSDTDAFRAGNVAFHLAVAKAGDNELLTAFMVALVTSLLEVTAAPLSAAKRDEVLRAHARITKAIVAGDAEAAAKHMREHLDAFASDRKRTRSSTRGEKKNARR